MIRSHVPATHYQVSAKIEAGCSNKIQLVTKLDALDAFSQLTKLTSFADDLFTELIEEIQERDQRIHDMYQNLKHIEGSILNIANFATTRTPWDLRTMSDDPKDEEEDNQDYFCIFTPDNRPEYLKRQLDTCERPPDFSELQRFAQPDKNGLIPNLASKYVLFVQEFSFAFFFVFGLV